MTISLGINISAQAFIRKSFPCSDLRLCVQSFPICLLDFSAIYIQPRKIRAYHNFVVVENGHFCITGIEMK